MCIENVAFAEVGETRFGTQESERFPFFTMLYTYKLHCVQAMHSRNLWSVACHFVAADRRHDEWAERIYYVALRQQHNAHLFMFMLYRIPRHFYLFIGTHAHVHDKWNIYYCCRSRLIKSCSIFYNCDVGSFFTGSVASRFEANPKCCTANPYSSGGGNSVPCKNCVHAEVVLRDYTINSGGTVNCQAIGR